MKGNIVVITGASGGIGTALAETFSQRGAVTVLAGRSVEAMRELAARLPGPADVVGLDVTSEASVADAVRGIVQRHGRIDVWINNAGYGAFKAFADTGMDEFAGMMDVNFFGTVRCTRAVLPHMLERGSGHIVNIASMAGKVGTAKSAAYTASKFAVRGFTQSLRMELRGTGVRVSAVNPGPVRTAFFQLADPSGRYLQSLPPWLLLAPEQVAAAVLKTVSRNLPAADLPRSADWAARIYQLFPRLLEPVAHRLLNRK